MLCYLLIHCIELPSECCFWLIYVDILLNKHILCIFTYFINYTKFWIACWTARRWTSTPRFSSLSFISNYPCKVQVRQRTPSVKTSVPHAPKFHIKVQLDAVPLLYDGLISLGSFVLKVFQFFSFNFSKILGWFPHYEHVKCVNFEKTANSEIACLVWRPRRHTIDVSEWVATIYIKRC